jgi:hypothetical protein
MRIKVYNYFHCKWYNNKTMASGETAVYDLPYPTNSDPVDVAGDIESLAQRIEVILPTIGLPYHTIEVTNVSGVSITKGDPVYVSGFNNTSGKPQVTKSQANTIGTFPVIGLAQSTISNSTDGVVVISGVFTGVNTSSYSVGAKLYVGSTGGLTSTQPITATTNSGVVGIVAKSNASGTILIGSFKGNGTWGSMKAGLA